jgi:tRNA-Thr(GGU) m(6)t(6)A37 methyltransferase TsaA
VVLFDQSFFFDHALVFLPGVGQMHYANIPFLPIGIIHSPFHDLAGMPIQPTSDVSAPGTLDIFPEFVPGLKDLDGFSHLILLYHLHHAGPARLEVTPFLDSQPRGIFATRAPTRPNPIGLSVVKLTRIEGNILYVEDLDILDGTPLLDIKPYIPEFDFHPEVRIGWLEQARGKVKPMASDNRFT